MDKENDELKKLRDERKKLEKQIKNIDDLAKEKQRIGYLSSQLKEKTKKPSKIGKTFKALKGVKDQAERMTHPERFKDHGKGERRKGRAGDR